MQLDLGCNFNSAELPIMGWQELYGPWFAPFWSGVMVPTQLFARICSRVDPGQCQNYYDSWARAVGGVGMKVNKLSWGKMG